MMINKGATLIGTVQFKNGNSNSFYVDRNRNTDELIMWQKVHGHRSMRLTGKNIAKFLDELDEVLNEGEAVWIQRHDAVLDALLREVRSEPDAPAACAYGKLY